MGVFGLAREEIDTMTPASPKAQKTSFGLCKLREKERAMGIQDRDWYREEHRRRRAEEEAAKQTAKAPSRPRQDPDDLIRRVNRSTSPKLWGADWHWSIQLLVWLCIVVLMLLAWRLVR